MTTTTVLLLIAGLVLLVIGAEMLVRGASRLAVALGVSPVIVGLTIVAYGTSSPEMAVSIGSAFTGQADMALGNVVGSNIFNVLFILGASAAIVPLIVAQQFVRLDVPIMIGVSMATMLMALDGRIGRIDGLILSAGAFAYTGMLIRMSRRESKAVREEYAAEFGEPATTSRRTWPLLVLLCLAGLGLLVLGSRWLVDGAVAIAEALGVSELIIGLTIVAAGTSLPEVATSVMASIKGERDIAVGNVVGSNIFNLLAVLGFSAAIAPDGVAVAPTALRFDLPVMIAVAIACLPIFFTGHLISRWEGLLFLGYYVAYLAFLILDATEHIALEPFTRVMTFFVVPLTAITLGIGVWRNRRLPAAAP